MDKSKQMAPCCISARRYVGPSSVLAALFAGAAVGVVVSFFAAWYFALPVGAICAAVFSVFIPWRAAARTRIFDAPAASLGEGLLLNEPVVLIFQKKHILGRLCLKSDTIYLFFRMQGRVAYLTFERKEMPIISYGQNRDFLLLRVLSPQKGAYLSSDDLLSNIPHIYETLAKNGWQTVDS